MAMAGTQIRVKLLLDNFFDDHRRKAFVTIDRSWSTVKQLQLHIQSLFHIKKFYLTTEDGFWFPPNEKIDALFGTDIIVAHVPQKQNTLDCFETPPDSAEVAPMEVVDESAENFMPNYNGFLTDFHKKTALTDSSKRKRIRTRKRKRNTASKLEPINFSVKDLNIPNNNPETGNLEKDETKSNERQNYFVKTLDEKCKNSNKCSKWVEDVKNLGVVDLDTDVCSSTFVEPKDICSKPSLHIRFSDSDDETDNECVPATSDVKLPQELPLKPRYIKGSYTEINVQNTVSIEKLAKKSVVNAIEPKSAIISIVAEGTGRTEERAPSSSSSSTSLLDTFEIVGDIKLKENEKEKKDQEQSNESAMEIMRKNIANLPLKSLQNLPIENQIIAFKMMKLNEKFEPTISEFIICMVQMVNENNLTLYVMAGSDHIKVPQGKLLMHDESAEDDNIISVEFHQLLDAKILEL